MDRSRILVVSNRLPVSLKSEREGKFTFTASSGGLVSALKGVQTKMVWIGWPGLSISPKHQEEICQALMRRNCCPVFLPESTAHDYYSGFSNELLWPLFHYMEGNLSAIDSQWTAYIQANRMFCEAVMKIYQPGDTIWIHDYHLLMLPQLLRRQTSPETPIGLFLHTPFPSSEIFRQLPMRKELLESMLHCNLIGFHTHDYARHFLSSVTRIIGATVDGEELHCILESDNQVHMRCRVATFPIGIDPTPLLEAIPSETVREHLLRMQSEFGERKS